MDSEFCSKRIPEGTFAVGFSIRHYHLKHMAALPLSVAMCTVPIGVTSTESRMHILVTGTAGFIGFHVAKRLLADGHSVVGVDNLNDYYDASLKAARLERLRHGAYRFQELNLANRSAVDSVFKEQFDRVIHLAAQSGVRWSQNNPHSYVDSNLVGFANVIECCRQSDLSHLIYASSSSVYGNLLNQPLDITMRVDAPVSVYAATKRANELIAHSYAQQFQLPVTGVRFFTVYGPWGRPDMAYFKFTRQILGGIPIEVYNAGELARDFTYIDDIVECLSRLTAQAPERTGCPARIFNAGAGCPVPLMEFIRELENALGIIAEKRLMPMQPGDVRSTWANTDALVHAIGFRPETSLKEGIRAFVEWYRTYYCIV